LVAPEILAQVRLAATRFIVGCLCPSL